MKKQKVSGVLVVVVFLAIAANGCGTGTGNPDVSPLDVADALVSGDIDDTGVNPDVVVDVEIDVVVPVDVAPEVPCVPDCSAIECGLDPVCHQSCGLCANGLCSEGICGDDSPECQKADGCTQNNDCASDQHCNTALNPPVCVYSYCAGVGSACSQNELCTSTLCSEGFCQYTKECIELECGPDPVNGESCGTCQDGFACETGKCVCVPDCGVTRECGTGRCGENCGKCIKGYGCLKGVCTPSEYGPEY